MKVRGALHQGRNILEQTRNESASLDASLLLAKAMQLNRAQIYMRLEDSIPDFQMDTFQAFVDRRAQGEPVAWILGKKEFWGRDFIVGPGVLCPRPDTETLVEAALAAMDRILCRPGQALSPPRLLDCCTGPGTIALTLAQERPEWRIDASDISPVAEKYFKQNAAAMHVPRATFHLTDLFPRDRPPFDMIVSNPPYLTPREYMEKQEQQWQEPEQALNGGGPDGLQLIERLISQAPRHLRPGGYLFIEAAPPQMPIIKTKLAHANLKDVQIYKDLAGRDRVISAQRETTS